MTDEHRREQRLHCRETLWPVLGRVLEVLVEASMALGPARREPLFEPRAEVLAHERVCVELVLVRARARKELHAA